MVKEYQALTRTYYISLLSLDRYLIDSVNGIEEQVKFFLEHGYLVIKQAFTKEQAAAWTETLWVRLGLDPNDKSSWDKERIHMPLHKRETVAEFAPKVRCVFTASFMSTEYRLIICIHKAWEAMKDLLGGEERIDEETASWGDSFIVNFGTPSWRRQTVKLLLLTLATGTSTVTFLSTSLILPNKHSLSSLSIPTSSLEEGLRTLRQTEST